MNQHIAELGTPHIDLAGLKLWIHGYQFAHAGDYWDGNWLTATAICSDSGATVQVRGAFIRNDEIAEWQQAVEELNADLAGEANLVCMEPELGVTLNAMPLGAVEMKVRITPHHLTQSHCFQFSIDQSYLTSLSSQCAQLLEAFPIRGS